MRVEKELFEILLARVGVVGVVVDTAADGVLLPEELKGHVLLEFGLDMPNPIKDMVSGDDALSAALSFGGKPRKVVIPWTAVLSLLPAAEEDSPQLAVTFLQPGMQLPEPAPKPAPAPKPVLSARGGLRRVK